MTTRSRFADLEQISACKAQVRPKLCAPECHRSFWNSLLDADLPRPWKSLPDFVYNQIHPHGESATVGSELNNYTSSIKQIGYFETKFVGGLRGRATKTIVVVTRRDMDASYIVIHFLGRF
jgi:hypothetical protein